MKSKEKNYVRRFLKGLNEKFAQVKSHIMLLDPLPLIHKVFSLIIQQEHEFSSVSESTILFTKGSQASGSFGSSFSHASGSKSNNSKTCTYCSKPRHTEETCSSLFG